MRIGIVAIPVAPSPAEPARNGAPLAHRIVTLAQEVERLGFHGIWLTDAFARGKATLDPLIMLGAIASQPRASNWAPASSRFHYAIRSNTPTVCRP